MLPRTKIQSLVCSKNFLGDEMLLLFCQVLPSTSLKKFDLSSCRFNDPGLLKLIDYLPQDKTLSSIKLADNFFSE